MPTGMGSARESRRARVWMFLVPRQATSWRRTTGRSGVAFLCWNRGDLATAFEECSGAISLTRPGANERQPVWAPNGEKITYFSDESGEYQLDIHSQDGLGDVVRIALFD